VRSRWGDRDNICAPRYDFTRISYERLPGGWYGFAMEYLIDGVPIIQRKQISVHFRRCELDVQS
jgi:hypothetical protein